MALPNNIVSKEGGPPETPRVAARPWRVWRSPYAQPTQARVVGLLCVAGVFESCAPNVEVSQGCLSLREEACTQAPSTMKPSCVESVAPGTWLSLQGKRTGSIHYCWCCSSTQPSLAVDTPGTRSEDPPPPGIWPGDRPSTTLALGQETLHSPGVWSGDLPPPQADKQHPKVSWLPPRPGLQPTGQTL